MNARWMAVATSFFVCQWVNAQPVPVIPTMSCQSGISILNTGYDHELSELIPDGRQDAQWWVSSTQADPTGSLGPSPSASWTPTSVPHTASVPPIWVSSSQLGGQVNWVSPLPNATSRPRPYPFRPAVTNYYRMQFNLAADIPPNALKLSVDYYNDDAMLGVFVNGVFQPLEPGGFFATSTQTAQLNGPWNSGLNTLIFSVIDAGWGSGLLAHIQPDSLLCETSLTIENTINKPSFVPAETANYTITASNPGPSDASLVTLSNEPPSALSNVSWSCTPANGAVCPSTLEDAPFSFDLPPNGQLVFSLSGQVAASGSLLSRSSIEPGPGAVCHPSTGCEALADAEIRAIPSPIPERVPGLGVWAVIALSLLTMGLALVLAHRHPRRNH